MSISFTKTRACKKRVTIFERSENNNRPSGNRRSIIIFCM